VQSAQLRRRSHATGAQAKLNGNSELPLTLFATFPIDFDREGQLRGMNRRPTNRKRRVTDFFWQLDSTEFARDGVFANPGKRGRITWADPWTGETLIQADYQFERYESEGQSLRLVVPAGSASAPITIKLATTDLHFGGRRWWFLCPGCQRRARILYSEKLSTPFLCRLCHSLAYETQLYHERGRALRAALKVRQRTGNPPIGSRFPPRPRGMHRETYWRLRDREWKAAKEYFGFVRSELAEGECR
jgi:hypothetical protein